MKLIPLIIANIKAFVRNWKSIIMLVIFPLLLIMVIFFSFNSQGLIPVPAGVVIKTDQLTYGDVQNLFSNFLRLNNIFSEEGCLQSVKLYQHYVCIIVRDNVAGLTIDVYYDNTRNMVIWEVIERIKMTVEFARKEAVKDTTTSFIQSLRSKSGKINLYENTILQVDSKLTDYTNSFNNLRWNLINSKKDLDDNIYIQERKVEDLRQKKDNLEYQKNYYYYELLNAQNQLRLSVNQIFYGVPEDQRSLYPFSTLYDYLNHFDILISNFNSETESELNNLERDISDFEDAIETGKEYSEQMAVQINKFPEIDEDLVQAKEGVDSGKKEISSLKQEFSVLDDLNIDQLLNPYILSTKAVYVPGFQRTNPSIIIEPESNIGTAQTSLNLLSLQTFFPSVLMLIVIFLSLLISAFITLEDINANSYKRLQLVPKIFFPQLFSIFISSHIIMMIPIIIVQLIVNFIFKLPIFNNLSLIILILFLVSSSFILIGMAMSYLIKNKAMTLLVNTFLLIFFIFFSGFLLPVDKMSLYARLFSNFFPAKIALESINQVLFYGGSIFDITSEILLMGVISLIILVLVLMIKKLRKS